MKTGKYILLRLWYGFIAFVLIIAMIATIYEIHYERTTIKKVNDMYRQGVAQRILQGDFEGISDEENKRIRAEVRQQVLTSFGLHRPLILRVADRTYKAITLNLGTTYQGGYGHRPVREVVLEALPNTLILFISTTIISSAIAIYLGVKKAQYVNSFFDRITSILTMFFIGIPSWVTGSFLILFFVYYLDILPFGSLYSTNPPPVGAINLIIDRLKHMAIPIMAVVLVRFWASSYQIKNIILGQLQEDYITASRGRGLPERKVVFGHALRTGSPAIFTMTLLSIVEAASGDIVLEKVLAWPGLGLLLWHSIQTNKMSIIMGVSTVLTLIFIIALIVLDIIYVLLDPRITYS